MTLLIEDHFNLLAECIQLESEAEAERLVERRKARTAGNEERGGDTLLDMVIRDSEPSLGGRQLVTFAKRNQQLALPWNRLRSGTPVVVSDQEAEGRGRTGVISQRSTHTIQVVINDRLEGNKFRVDRSPDEVTRKRQLKALSRALKAKGRTAQLRDVMFGERDPDFRPNPKLEKEGLSKAGLNESQRSAVEFAMAARDLAIIHGPPGTGKTTTVVEVIRQAVATGQTVLACGPSNTAVDNLLVKLVQLDLHAVRIGHPARVARELQANTLDALVEKHENTTIAADMIREAEQIYRKLDRYTRAKPRRGQRNDMRAEANQLKQHARMLEHQAIDHVLDQAEVICATTTGDDDNLRDRFFDLVVIDEACQSVEPGSWIPLLRAERLVMAGDHCQLPPTVLSKEAAAKGFDVSLMQRMIEHYGDTVTRQLDVQYRMHRDIMNFSSKSFYNETLIAHESVESHTLDDLSTFDSPDLASEPAQFIDTAGAGWDEELEPNGLSKLNKEEGLLILKRAKLLCEAGLQPREIAVIAPYAAQVRFIRDRCNIEGLEIDTVDGFQGREKEAVLISMVRSNREGELGFLSDSRRMNVALTRAKRKLIVVGDSATLGHNEFFVAMLEYFESIGGYHSVWEETDS